MIIGLQPLSISVSAQNSPAGPEPTITGLYSLLRLFIGLGSSSILICFILGYLVSVGVPRLDSFGRPAPYYSETIHERCPRRRFFDKGVYAKKFGDEECMFLLGCRGPETFAYCPVSRWNNTENWPIEDNTTCIGCASPGFPDKMEPFVQYGGGFR